MCNVDYQRGSAWPECKYSPQSAVEGRIYVISRQEANMLDEQLGSKQVTCWSHSLFSLFVTDRVSRQGKAIDSVRLSVRLFPLYPLNRLTFKLELLCVGVMSIARLGLKVKVICQGQRSMSSACGRGNAVITRSFFNERQLSSRSYNA